MPPRRASGVVARAPSALAALCLCLSVLGLAATPGAATPGNAAPGDAAPGAGAGPTFPMAKGAYVGAANPAGLTAFDAATDTRSTMAADYLPANAGWSGVEGADGSLTWLFAQGWTGTRYRLSLGVPVIPTDSAGHPVGTLSEGASGAYDGHFVALARTLIAAGESDTYLRLGWEFDGTWTAWKATRPSSEANFAAYFRQIVTAMRSVRGGHFTFVWNPDAIAFTSSNYKVELAYPGDRYVDVVGLDTYDQSWATPLTPSTAWSHTVLPSLTAADSFAHAHGKPIAITEWGTAIRTDGHGLGDDPLYVTNMIAWMKVPSHDVVYETYFDYDGQGTDSVITGGRFPHSLEAFGSAFKRTYVAPGARRTRAAWWVPAAAVVSCGALGWRWRRRVRRRRLVEPQRRRIHPPVSDVEPTPVREWAEQTH